MKQDNKNTGKSSSNLENERKAVEENLKKWVKMSETTLQRDISSLSTVYKDMANILQNAVDNAEKFGKNWADVEDIAKKFLKNLKSIGDESFEQIDFAKQMAQLADKRKKVEQDQIDAAKQVTQAVREEKNAKKELRKLEQKLRDAKKSGTAADIEAAKQAKEMQESKVAEATLAKDLMQADKDKADYAHDNLETQEKILTQLEAQQNVLEAANKKAIELGINVKELADEIAKPFQKAVDFIEGLPGGKLLSKAFGLDVIQDKVKDSIYRSFTKSLAEAGDGGSKFFTIFKAGFKAAIAGARTFLIALAPIIVPLAAIAATLYAIKKAFDMDQEVTDMARNLGMTKKEALGIRRELNDIAASTNVVGASTEELVKEYQVLAKVFGVSKIANAELAETQVYLTKQLGMASEEAANFQKMSMATGRTAYQNLAVIKAGVESMTGGLMNYKEVANDIAKSSKSVQAAYKGNIAALVKATITAKKFGMTLDETKKSADAILDIESSVESEMKANVLTGKHMNLNAARQLAIQGKSAEAVEEMMKQAGGYDELMDMAPYKQRAIADAMGMSVDEMIKAAEQQKNLNTMASELGITLDENGKMSDADLQRAMASNNEEAKKLAMQQQVASAQEKLAAMGDKLMTIFAKIAEPIMEMLDPLFTLIDVVFPLIKLGLDIAFAPLKFAFNMIASIVKLLTLDFSGAVDSFKNAFVSIVPSAAQDLFGIGSDKSTGISGGSMTSVNDAMIDPGGGLVVSGPKGSYQLDSNDSIIAGTNLQPTTGDTSNAGVASSGNSEVISLLKQLIAKIDQPIKINIGGRVIEELESQASMRRSYNTKIDGAYGVNG